MHTDDHILQSFLGAKGPLPTIALDLGMTLIALVQWIDRNADLLAVAKRAMETHIAFLALRAEAAALIDLTQVSTSTTNEERKRKSASQLLRHSAKRLLTAVGAPPTSRNASPPSPRGGFPPSPRPSGEKSPSTEGAKGMRGVPISPSTATSSLDASMPPALTPSSPPSPRPSGEKSLSTEGAKGMRGASMAHDAAVAPSSTNPERELRAPCASVAPADLLHKFAPSSLPNAQCPMPNASSFSDHEIDVLMATLARHFDIDISSDAPDPAPA